MPRVSGNATRPISLFRSRFRLDEQPPLSLSSPYPTSPPVAFLDSPSELPVAIRGETRGWANRRNPCAWHT